MYTRCTTFPLNQDQDEKAVEIAHKYGKVIHDLPGHVSTVMFVAGDSMLSITTWDTEEHAEAVTSTRDDAQRDLAGVLSGAPTTTISETVVHDLA